MLVKPRERTKKMDGIKTFTNKEFGTVRTIVKDGEPWFVGKDVAEILGYSNTPKGQSPPTHTASEAMSGTWGNTYSPVTRRQHAKAQQRYGF